MYMQMYILATHFKILFDSGFGAEGLGFTVGGLGFRVYVGLLRSLWM